MKKLLARFFIVLIPCLIIESCAVFIALDGTNVIHNKADRVKFLEQLEPATYGVWGTLLVLFCIGFLIILAVGAMRWALSEIKGDDENIEDARYQRLKNSYEHLCGTRHTTHDDTLDVYEIKTLIHAEMNKIKQNKVKEI